MRMFNPNRQFMRHLFYVIFILCLSGYAAQAADHELRSPDGNIVIKITTGSSIQWSVQYKNETVLFPSDISLTTNGEPFPGAKTKVLKQAASAHSDTVFSIVPVKNSWIPNVYKELKLVFAGGITLCFRAYNKGVAYRFELDKKVPSFKIDGELVSFNFDKNNQAWWPEENNKEFISHYEGLFTKATLDTLAKDKYAYLPLYQSTPAGTKLLITESDLYDYPNLFLFNRGEGKLEGKFPPAVLKSHIAPRTDRREVLAEKAPYIADTKGTRTLPWRLIMIAPDDVSLLSNEMVFQLATPADKADYSWIKPGKVAWDWYNANNVFGVDFESGINNKTYQYYIDFAARFGLEYVILDEGWSRTTTDVSAPRKEIDVAALVKYGAAKGVGIILWSLWRPIDENMDSVLNRFVEWGVKGVKIDFIQRADQYTVNYYERVAKACMARKLLVDFHGAYKPSGLNRKYPNVINYEGVKGLENNKWADYITPEHNLTLPFTRMMAGPLDYTPGAMRNTNKKDFRVSFNEPVSRGTRAHQAAMYVMYEAPLQMLAETPSLYLQDTAFTQFIARIPTTWNKTIPLHGKIGTYAAVARQNGDKWYISAMTDWEGRSLDAKLDFLSDGNYRLEVLTDGVNTTKYATDYKRETRMVKKGDVLTMKMAPGGGWTAILTPLTPPQKAFTLADTLRGSLTPERTWWDIQRYDLTVKPNYNAKTISGISEITYKVTGSNARMQIDMAEPLLIDSVLLNHKTPLTFSKVGSVWYIQSPKQAMNAINSVAIYYHGKAHEAVRPPWDGGWTWTTDSLGRPWMTVTCQGLGASIWYPCKDHQSDEPDKGASLTMIVPDTLTAISMGRLESKKANGDGTTSWKWAVVNPISNYCIIPYIGKYVNWSEVYKGEKGNLDVNYWVLDYNTEKAKAYMPTEVHNMLGAFEHWFGPYPFYEDGYKLVETSNTGMEHQSAVSYGNWYKPGYRGRDGSGTGWGMKWDFIIIHESGHEWFGNNITTNDLADMWVHEGFTNYSETLFTDYIFGEEAANQYNRGIRRGIRNDRPIIPAYNVNAQGSGDMYPKPSNMLHSIRHGLNDDQRFREITRGLNKQFYHQTVTTRQIENYVSSKAGFDYSKVFDQYLRTIQIPTFEYYFSEDKKKVFYRYANCVAGFNLPLVLKNKATSVKIKPTEQWQSVSLNDDAVALFDKTAIEAMYYVTVVPVVK